MRCSLEHDRLDLLDSTRHVGVPLRLRPRYAGLPLSERLAKLRAIWQRRNGKSIQIQVRHESIFDDVLRATTSIDVSALAAAKIKFQFDRGQDAGGVSRHVFTVFGQGLTRVTGVSSTGEALSRMRTLLKSWRVSFEDEDNGEEDMIRQIRAVLDEQARAVEREEVNHANWVGAPPPAPPPTRDATPTATRPDMVLSDGTLVIDGRSAAGGDGAASSSSSSAAPVYRSAAVAASSASPLSAVAEEGEDQTSEGSPPEAKRQRVDGPSAAPAATASSADAASGSERKQKPPHARMPKLFKLTESGSLAPSGAETLARRVGEATDESGAIVPTLNELTLNRYRAIGRVCALALVNGQTLGLPFARYFLRMVLREPPVGLQALQEELQHEDPSFLGRPEFLEKPLNEFGMAEMMTFSRQVSNAALNRQAPLAKNPDAVVTDANKTKFLERSLEHQLVLTIAAQADSFREGVEDVTGQCCLQLLSASELKELWGGHEIDDEHLAKWQAASRSTPTAAQQATFLWEWLKESTPAKRAAVLQFATGSARLPGEVDLQQWCFTVERLERPMVVQPTESNGLSAPAMCAKASTCARTLCLPNYEDREALARGMEYSLMDGGFGMA